MTNETGSQKSWMKCSGPISSKRWRREGIGGAIFVAVVGFGGMLLCQYAASQFARDTKEPIQVLTRKLPVFGEPVHIISEQWVIANQLAGTLLVISIILLVLCISKAAEGAQLLARIEKLEGELEAQRKTNETPA